MTNGIAQYIVSSTNLTYSGENMYWKGQKLFNTGISDWTTDMKILPDISINPRNLYIKKQSELYTSKKMLCNKLNWQRKKYWTHQDKSSKPKHGNVKN